MFQVDPSPAMQENKLHLKDSVYSYHCHNFRVLFSCIVWLGSTWNIVPSYLRGVSTQPWWVNIYRTNFWRLMYHKSEGPSSRDRAGTRWSPPWLHAGPRLCTSRSPSCLVPALAGHRPVPFPPETLAHGFSSKSTRQEQSNEYQR